MCATCKQTLYCNRTCQKKDWPTHKASCEPPKKQPIKKVETPVARLPKALQEGPPAFELVEIDGKGPAVLATRDIRMGELIIGEEALFALEGRDEEHLQQLLTPYVGNGPKAQGNHFKLSEEERRQYWNLRDSSHKKKTAMGIYQDNALPLGARSRKGGIFIVCSSINHSCSPNVHHSWNDFLEVESIYAIQNIAQGEEILTCFISDRYSTRKQRRDLLSRNFGFLCECAVCTLPIAESQASDERRSKMKLLNDQIYGFVSSRNSRRALIAAKMMMELMEEEGIDVVSRANTCYDAFQACSLAQNWTEAKKWVKQAYDFYLIGQGPDDATTQKMLRYYNDPSSHRPASGCEQQ